MISLPHRQNIPYFKNTLRRTLAAVIMVQVVVVARRSVVELEKSNQLPLGK